MTKNGWRLIGTAAASTGVGERVYLCFEREAMRRSEEDGYVHRP